MAYSQDRPTVDVTRARQGRLGRNIVFVLMFGVILTVLGFALTWAWKASDLASVEPNNKASPSQAAAFNAPRPDAASRQNYQKGGPLAPKNGGNPQ
jgi:hypothetical protein